MEVSRLSTIDIIANEIFDEYDEVFKALQASETLDRKQVINGEQLINDLVKKYFKSIKILHYNEISFVVNMMDKILYEQINEDEYKMRLLLSGKIILTEIISRRKMYKAVWNEDTEEYFIKEL